MIATCELPGNVCSPISPVTVHSAPAWPATGSVFRSDDAGDHWEEMSDGLPGGIVTSLAADPRGANILYAGTYGQGLYRMRVEE